MYRSVLPILLASVAPASALIGYGINMYHPLCATACRSSFASAQLNCSVESHGGGGGHGGHGGGHWTTTPACRASDVPFLSTLAYCISQTCDDDILVWEREKYWITKTTGDINVLASLSYGEALATARKEIGDTKPPQLEKEQILNFTASVDLESWKANKLSNEYFEYEEVRHSRFGLITLLLGFAIPIALTLVLYLPFMSSVADRIRPYLISSTVLGYHIRPLPWLMGNPPTIGQALYIFSFFSLNVILTSIDYKSNQPSTWFDTRWQEMAAYVANRTGVIAFALAPLVILFSTRNNFLLWMTNWSHSTFLLLHRWVARIFTLQVIIHSIVELAFHLDLGDYETELVTEYWIWGCVATVAASAMMVFSVLWFRRVAYEAFLILHILLAAFVIIGSWYHVEFLFFRKWGYEMWLYAACAVWFFDRLVRVLRVLKIGVKRAEITDLGGGIVRVDIDGVKWANEGRGVHTYIYFPNLSRWRFWENIHSPSSPPL